MLQCSRRSGFSLLEVAIYAIILVIMGTLVSGIGNTQQSVNANITRDQILIIDTALSTYYMSNSSTYPPNTVTGGVSKSGLQLMQDTGLLPSSQQILDVAKFAYTPGTAGGAPAYQLSEIATGYLSPRSREFNTLVPGFVPDPPVVN